MFFLTVTTTGPSAVGTQETKPARESALTFASENYLFSSL